jgi:hypothetical protein
VHETKGEISSGNCLSPPPNHHISLQPIALHLGLSSVYAVPSREEKRRVALAASGSRSDMDPASAIPRARPTQTRTKTSFRISTTSSHMKTGCFLPAAETHNAASGGTSRSQYRGKASSSLLFSFPGVASLTFQGSSISQSSKMWSSPGFDKTFGASIRASRRI